MYQVYALKYAERDMTACQFFYREASHAPLTLHYYVWLILGGPHPILVDTGFLDDEARARGIRNYVSPAAMVERAGIKPGDVPIALIPHLHYDHWAGHSLFPRAEYWIQRDEVAFWTGPFGRYEAFRQSANPHPLARLAPLHGPGRGAWSSRPTTRRSPTGSSGSSRALSRSSERYRTLASLQQGSRLMEGWQADIPTAAVDASMAGAARASATKGLSRAPGGIGIDCQVVVLSAVFVGGLFLDGWAHAHGRVDQSFFTPWHAVFYAGYAAVASALVTSLLRNRARGYPWRRALPAGYGLSLLGALIFGVGGVGDMIWHMLFGIEAGVEALLSPMHLALGLGLGLIVWDTYRLARM